MVYEGEERRTSSVPTGLIVPVWLASILAVAIIGSVTGIIHNQNKNRYDLGILAVKMESLTKQIEVGMDSRYRASKAESDFMLRDVQIEHLIEEVGAIKLIVSGCQKRIRKLEGIVDKIENKTGD